MEKEDYKNIYDFIENQLDFKMIEYATKRRRLKLPLIPPKIFSSLLEDVSNLFSKEPSMLELNGDFVIVGCLYGHEINLLQILSKYGSPSKQKYLFLGNLVGYGEFSVEVVLTVFLMKALFPGNVYIIRGDSEFGKSCISNGFKNEIEMKYENSSLFPLFMKAFSVLPITAVINKKAFCVSGGIGKSIFDLESVKIIRKPIIAICDQTIIELLISDPTDVLPMFLPASREKGNLFGSEACKQFLRETELKVIIRGRQIVASGFECKFDGKLFNLCSADGVESENKSGVVICRSSGISGEAFDCLPPIKRTEINYIASISDEKWELQKASVSDNPISLLSSDYYSKNSGLRLSTLTIGTANIKSTPPPRKILRNAKSVSGSPGCYSPGGYTPGSYTSNVKLPQKTKARSPSTKMIATKQILKL